MPQVLVQAGVDVTEVLQAAIKKEGVSYVLTLLAVLVEQQDMYTGETLALISHLSKLDRDIRSDVLDAVRAIAERE